MYCITMISILIPLYNGIEFLEQAVKSVVNQTYTEWEIIIGINGHPPSSITEHTAISIQQSFPDHLKIKVIYYNTEGKAATLNAMKNDITYQHIAILDVDDIWHHKKLEKQMPYIHDYHVVGTKCRYFGDFVFEPPLPTGDLSTVDFLESNPIINSSAIIHKSCFDIDETSPIEDYELWLKLKYEKRSFYNVDDVLCYHRIHQDSAFNNTNHQYVDDVKRKWFYHFNP